MQWWQVVLVVYAWMSTITFVLYGVDKRRARRQKPRIAESTLHWYAFLCGFPGAIVAMQVFRHKTHKTRFLFVFWGIVFVHLVAWSTIGAYLWNHRA